MAVSGVPRVNEDDADHVLEVHARTAANPAMDEGRRILLLDLEGERAAR